jgi:hypothetical protein
LELLRLFCDSLFYLSYNNNITVELGYRKDVYVMTYFVNDVQQLKYEVFSKIAKLAFDNSLTAENLMDVDS